MKCSLGISDFLEEISSLFYSVVFLYFFALRKTFLPLLAILWNSTFKWVYLSFSPLLLTSFLISAVCKAFSDNHFAFLHFFFFEMVLITASCTMLGTSIHSSLGTLSIRSNPLNLFKGHGGEFWKNMDCWRREWQASSSFLPWEAHKQYERQNDMILKDEIPRSMGV